MKLFIIVLGIIVISFIIILGTQNDKVYKACVDEGIHTNERCFELAYR